MYFITDNNGLYTGLILQELNGEQFYSEVPILEFFIKPKWNGTQWVEGATPEQIAEYRTLLVPQEVQLWKIRTVISLMGLKETIENVMNNLEEPTKSAALNIWNYGTAVDRNSQTVLMIQSVLQMTDVEVDNMFIQANNIIL